MFSSTLGPAPSHLTLYSPAASDLPLTVTGPLTMREPLLLAANALVASSKASPSSKPLDVFENFIRLLVLSRKRRESVLGGLGFTFVKNLRFVCEGLQCCRGVKQRGLGRKTRSLCSGDCSHLGRQTESEISPFNPKNFSGKPSELRRVIHK